MFPYSFALLVVSGLSTGALVDYDYLAVAVGRAVLIGGRAPLDLQRRSLLPRPSISWLKLQLTSPVPLSLFSVTRRGRNPRTKSPCFASNV